MNPLIQLKMTTLALLVQLVFVCFALCPMAQAVSPPLAPDTALPGGNTADGHLALASLTTGTNNTAVGVFSLLSLTDGKLNTGVGAGTLLANTANQNTATGAAALFSNTTGFLNTATGAFALFSNDDGTVNSAFGFNALSSHTTGNSNTAVGSNALLSNVSGQANTAVGDSALQNATGSGNIALGISAGVNVNVANQVICIGSPGDDVSGSCFIGHIRGVTTNVADAVPVLIDSVGQLGTASSSRRFKHDINPMDCASESILALKPVTFHYKTDATDTPQFGLIAEEVAEINPDLVVRDKNGEIYTVRYDAVNAMLLNEFIKEHRKVAEQEKRIDALTAQLKEQAALIQKVSDKVELNKPAPQTVLNNQ
jgi:endosialidase-like protein